MSPIAAVPPWVHFVVLDAPFLAAFPRTTWHRSAPLFHRKPLFPSCPLVEVNQIGRWFLHPPPAEGPLLGPVGGEVLRKDGRPCWEWGSHHSFCGRVVIEEVVSVVLVVDKGAKLCNGRGKNVLSVTKADKAKNNSRLGKRNLPSQWQGSYPDTS